MSALSPTVLPPAGQVLVVAADGSGDFTQIQPAIDAAADGSTILVKSGTYALFSIVNEALTVAADAGHVVQVGGSCQVRNLLANKTVVLSGLSIVGAPGPQTWSGVGLRLKNNAGPVRVQDCSLTGTNGALVEDCPDVAFVGTTLEGSPAVLSSGSSVACYDGHLLGTHGSTGACYCTDGGDGGSTNGFLFASGSEFRGGEGADADNDDHTCCGAPFLNGCDGGDGLVLPPGADVVLLESTTQAGGFGGLGDCCFGQCGLDGSPGSGISPLGGTLDVLPSPGRKMESPAVVREQTVVPLTFVGQPGDVVRVYLSRKPGFQYSPVFRGVHLTQLPPQARVLNFGTMPGSGTLNSQIVFPDYGPGVESKIFQLQAVFLDTNGQWTLGSSKSIVLLDQAF